MNDDAIMLNNESYQGHNHDKGSLLVTFGASISLAKFILSILNDRQPYTWTIPIRKPTESIAAPDKDRLAIYFLRFSNSHLVISSDHEKEVGI